MCAMLEKICVVVVVVVDDDDDGVLNLPFKDVTE
jgi:hypothetical protein